jgi:hypothetical protein
MKVIFFLGTAGSGKSSMAFGAQRWFQQRGTHALTANLDPGAERLPYVPDIDVRDYIRLDEVMDEYGLGPNGGIIASSDLMADNFDVIREEIEDYEPDYLLIDTPGQLELFVFRASGIFIVRALRREETIAAFLVDPFLTQTPSSFVSILLLSLTAELKLGIPTIRVLSKADILSEDQMQTVDSWVSEPEILNDALLAEGGPATTLATRLCRMLGETEESFKILKASAREGWGYEDLYTEIQVNYEGGEDFIVPGP